MPTIIYGMQQLAQNVQDIIVPNSGHFIPEVQPEFVIDQLFKFFGNSNNGND
jgi:pimeloyl-ACP methyl ester carboxylesterase